MVRLAEPNHIFPSNVGVMV